MTSMRDYMLMEARAHREWLKEKYRQRNEEIEHGFKSIPFKCRFCQTEGQGDFKREDGQVWISAVGPCPSCHKQIKFKIRLCREEPL